MPADAGIRFGQYVLLRRIARGGMAEVFLAQQRGLEGFDRRVAVKRILPHLADSPDFVKMFLGEARLAAQLSHPNIVHIYEFGKVEQDYFIAMEFVDGVHAGQLYKYGHDKDTDRIPATLVARIGADAANALHHAHELRSPAGKAYGLVHRDVSPANIMVSFDGVVKLCDFGIAKAAAVGDQLTNPGQVKGKYAYMSPEQTIASPLDGRSDVFSLAIVMWELLTGRYIVQRGDAVEAMRALRDGRIEPIQKVNPAVPAPLATAVMWALEAKRDRRATAADFAQALEAFIKSSPELATGMQLGAWVRQRFVREGTGQHQAIGSPGTNVAAATGAVGPGTQVAPSTVIASGTQGPVTPPMDGRAASIVGKLADLGGTGAFDASDLDEAADTFKVKPPKFPPRGPLDATVLDDGTRRAEEEATLRRGEGPVVGEDTEIVDGTQTLVRESSQRPIVPSGPTVVPTMIAPQLADSGARRAPGSGPRPRPSELAARDGVMPRRTTPVPAELLAARRTKTLVAIAGLVGLAVISFVIALAASGSHAARPAVRDAGAASTGSRDARATIAVVSPPADAGTTATPPVASDAAAPEPPTLLEVRTIPDGGTVKVGDQSRAAPAKLLLAPGTYKVTAELAGYQAEERDVDLDRGQTRSIEITFRHKLAHAAGMGRLTVRTTPYSNVYDGDRLVGQSPFADVELAPGTHTLTFKNPSHAPMTKTVKISAGKTTKLNFALE